MVARQRSHFRPSADVEPLLQPPPRGIGGAHSRRRQEGNHLHIKLETTEMRISHRSPPLPLAKKAFPWHYLNRASLSFYRIGDKPSRRLLPVVRVTDSRRRPRIAEDVPMWPHRAFLFPP